MGHGDQEANRVAERMAYYRSMADDARRLAEIATSSRARSTCLAIATSYEKLAASVADLSLKYNS
jgi:hypothetical protein